MITLPQVVTDDIKIAICNSKAGLVAYLMPASSTESKLQELKRSIPNRHIPDFKESIDVFFMFVLFKGLLQKCR